MGQTLYKQTINPNFTVIDDYSYVLVFVKIAVTVFLFWLVRLWFRYAANEFRRYKKDKVVYVKGFKFEGREVNFGIVMVLLLAAIYLVGIPLILAGMWFR